MIRIKSGVKVEKGGKKATPELLLGLMVAASVYDKYGYDCVITSLLDGTHSTNSLHYQGQAGDLRTRHLPDLSMKRAIRDDIAAALGRDYDAVLESDHIHLEYDKKD